MFYSCILCLQIPNHCRKYRREIISNFLDGIVCQLLILCFPVTNSNDWFVIRMINVISLLQRFYSSDLILCCKLLCSNYHNGGYSYVDIMTSQISIPMPINSELSCLHSQLGFALLQAATADGLVHCWTLATLRHGERNFQMGKYLII